MRAPMVASGAITLAIGRADKEASPVSSLAKRWPASSPASSRIPVPALPQSSGSALGRSPCKPTPCTTREPGEGVSMRTPSCCRMRAVARVVLAFEEAVDARRAFRDRRQHQRPVRDRLVAGHAQAAAQGATASAQPVQAHASASSSAASRRSLSARVPRVRRRQSGNP
jgi:hypothetical protein